jgi:hypothetical protein
MKDKELDEIANKLGLELIRKIHKETFDVSSDLDSKFEYVLNKLIKNLSF